MAQVKRIMTASLAGQVATLTPIAALIGQPEHLVITAATITFSANAATEINSLDEYVLTLERRTDTT